MPEIIYKTAYEASNGKILWVSYGPEEIILFPEDQGFNWVDGEWNEATHYVVNDVATPRPATGLPATHTISANTDWAVPNVPEGTLVYVDDVEMGSVDASGLVLNFEAAGVWQVNIKPPFPFLEANCEVTVT